MTRTIQILRGTTAQNNAFTGAAGELTMDTTRKELRVHDGSTVGGKVVSLTPGFIAPFAGSTAPDGWLVCDGSAVSRTTYADLFAVIGTTYGEGDGNSTFNLPPDSVLPLGLKARVGVSGTVGQTGDGILPTIARNYDSTDKTKQRVMSSLSAAAQTPVYVGNTNRSDGDRAQVAGIWCVFNDLMIDLSTATGAKAIVCIKY